MNILAWIIIALFVFFAIIPWIGSLFTSWSADYSEDLSVGLVVIFILSSIAGVLFAVMWAFNQVLH